MTRTGLVRYLNPWLHERQKEQQRLDALRKRDGDNCRRCRRPIRFDLPRGHDKGPTVESVLDTLQREPDELDNLCLCHRRCNAELGDNTVEVQERVRRRSEAALFPGKRARVAG